MERKYLSILACPECKGSLSLYNETHVEDENVITGELVCQSCSSKYLITNSIPRFVPESNYADNFGLQWKIHAKTQFDSYTNTTITKDRFHETTGWDFDLSGERVLEVGCGAGRFTEQIIKTNALVISMDYSQAVDVCYASLGSHKNLLIIQGDIYKMPLHVDYFDKVCCLGVLQHTPNVEAAFQQLPQFVKPSGHLAIDVYKKEVWYKRLINTRYMIRPLTKRISPEKLYKFVKAYVSFMWPICGVLNKLPFGKSIVWRMLIADYRGSYNLSDDLLLQWAILDTFDMLAPVHDYPKTLEDVNRWLMDSKL